MSDVKVELVPSSPVPTKWVCDWACPRCARYGGILVEVTGGPRDHLTGKLQPNTDDEEFRKRLWQAHRDASHGLCPEKVKRLLLGKLWQWQRKGAGRMMVILTNPKEPPITDYRWPPARPPWAPK